MSLKSGQLSGNADTFMTILFADALDSLVYKQNKN